MSSPDSPDPLTALRALADGGVRFVVIGQVAATLHGAATTTFDIDVCYERSPENIKRLVAVLSKLNARLRVARDAAESEVPFQLDERTIERGGNFTFETDLGALDCLAWPAGVGGYDELSERADTFELDGLQVMAASIDDLLHMKRKAGRRKDLPKIWELEEVRKMREAGEI